MANLHTFISKKEDIVIEQLPVMNLTNCSLICHLRRESQENRKWNRRRKRFHHREVSGIHKDGNPEPVLGIREILVRKRIPGSVSLTIGFGTPDPTPLFSDFKDAKKKFFSYYFLITYQLAHYLQSLNPNADKTAQKSQKRIL